MELLDGPAIVTHPDRHTAGIRVVTPFRGMFAVRDKLMAELYERGYDGAPTYFRLHVVDMAGSMDVEVGVVTPGLSKGDERVRPGVLPGGRYAALKYVNHGRRANVMLIDWIREQKLAMDVVENPAGDRFGCRYEAYLTDPRTERMKTRWQIELAVRLAD